jgi:hypothetical protein
LSRMGNLQRAVLLMMVLFLGACYYDNEEELYPDNFCDTQAVTWSGTIQPLMQTRCALPGCHVPGAQSPDLSNYTSVKAQADAGRIRARAIDGTPSIMPPSGRMPSCDQAKLDAWLQLGAPNN